MTSGELSDVLSGWARVLATMHFPKDEVTRANYQARLSKFAVAERRHELAQHEEHGGASTASKDDESRGLIEVTKRIKQERIKVERVRGFEKFGGFELDEAALDQDRLVKMGEVAGRILQLKLRYDKHGTNEKLSDVSWMVRGISIMLRECKDEKKNRSERYVWQCRSEFRSVMHFWAAWNDLRDKYTRSSKQVLSRSLAKWGVRQHELNNNRLGMIEPKYELKRPWDLISNRYPITEFLARAEAYYELAQSTEIQKWGEANPEPIIEPHAAWRASITPIKIELKLEPLSSVERSWLDTGYKEYRAQRG